MNEPRTLQRKLHLWAAVFMVSLFANLALSSICILSYLQPAYYDANRNLKSQQQVEQIRILLRRYDAVLRTASDNSDVGPERVRLGRDLKEAMDEPQRMGSVLAGMPSWPPLHKAIQAQLLALPDPPRAQAEVPASGPAPGGLRLEETDRSLADLSEQLGQRRYESVVRSTNLQQWVISILAASTALGAGLCLAGLLLVRRWVVRPIADLSVATCEIRRGNFRYQVKTHQADELGRLGEEINQMTVRVLVLQEQLLEQERLSAASDALGKMRGTLRQPLLEIRALAKSVSDRSAHNLIVSDCHRRMVETVDRFESWLDLLHESLGANPLRFQPVSICDLVSEVVAAVRPMLDRSGVELTVNIDPAIGQAEVDRLHFAQAVLALLTNAIQACSEGQTIAMHALRLQDDSQQWRVSIRDTGCGIPPEIMAHIFEPFFTTKSEGSGVGLALAQKVLRLHGGTLSVTSEPGQGTEFSCVLPLTSRSI